MRDIPLSHLGSWWVQASCACGRSSCIALRSYADRSGIRRLGDLLAPLRCKACRVQPAEIWLAERADAGGFGGAGDELLRVRM
jgi:hypothetical protein